MRTWRRTSAPRFGTASKIPTALGTWRGSVRGERYTIHKTPADMSLGFAVSPLDALVQINALNRRGAAFQPGVAPADEPWYYDVNGDGWVTAQDVLQVIACLNADSLSAGEGEGGGSAATQSVPLDAGLLTPSLSVAYRGEDMGSGPRLEITHVAGSGWEVIGTADAFCLGVLSRRVHVVFALKAGGTLEDRPVYNKSRCFETFPFLACEGGDESSFEVWRRSWNHTERGSACSTPT